MRRRRIVKYTLCILMSVLLVGLAFYLPQLALRIQDRQNLSKYNFQSRTGIDYEAVNTEYITDRVERLSALAKSLAGGTQYYILSTDAEFPEEDLKDLFLHQLQAQNMYWILYGLYETSGMVDFFDIFHLARSEYYVIYSADSVGGTTLLCWYLELEQEIGDHDKIRFLIDAKDSTIYYQEVYSPAIKETWQSILEGNIEPALLLDEMPGFFIMDYGADDVALEEIGFLGGPAPQWKDGAQEGVGLEVSDSLGIMAKGEEAGSAQASWDDGATAGGQVEMKEVVWNMLFPEGSLHIAWYFATDDFYEMPGMCFGIQELADLLPLDSKGLQMN